MRGANTLIPARFLTLVGHFCVLVTLLWESNRSVRHCLPSRYYDSHFQIYHSRLVGGLITSIVLIAVEFTTFIFGLTMFSPSVALTYLSLSIIKKATKITVCVQEFGVTFLFFSMLAIYCDLIWLESYNPTIAGHGFASMLLTYFVLDGWLCDWFWPIFFFCSVLPSLVDFPTAIITLCTSRW